ncbi:MAG: diiron oxygenase [Actinobacteria bacterium]|nr:diiron oxygenase [Actinomycetota bacterium]
MTLVDATAPPSTLGTVDDELVVDAERTSRERFESLVRRLSEQSVAKHYDAYADIPWDDPEFAVDPDDPRWALVEFDPLGATDWYKAQPMAVRSRIGLYRAASAAKVGGQFENVLKRGLLEYTFFRLANNDPSFRYVYHEVAEETHHGMMFQELVDRTNANANLDISGMPLWLKLLAQSVIPFGSTFPELFFIFVLGGEDPIDHVQRETLRSGRDLPPILEIIVRHHVTEEARHLSFARHYLKRQVPTLPWWRKQVLAFGAPIILGIMAQIMLAPPRSMAKEFAIPADVLRDAYRDNPQAMERTRDAVRKVRRLCRELGLITFASKRVWKRFGIYADD